MDRLGGKFDVVVNIQGDEPLIEPGIIDDVVRALQRSPDAVYSTPVTPLKREEVHLHSRVKCIVDQRWLRHVLQPRDDPQQQDRGGGPRHEYLLHLGLQCYDAKFLRIYPKPPPTPLQLQEDLEQLKVIEHGYRMKVVRVNHCAHGVDEPGDVASIEAIMDRQGLP